LWVGKPDANAVRVLMKIWSDLHENVATTVAESELGSFKRAVGTGVIVAARE
jgi:hypothetical protein